MKSIDTAPKDGTPILVYDGEFNVARWDVDRWETGWLVCTYPDGQITGRYMVYGPTHWDTLPDDPE